MQTRKVNEDGRGKRLSPWLVFVFSLGAVEGALLSPRHGPVYTIAAIIVTGWLVALMLVASDLRISLPRVSSRLRRGGPPRTGADGGVISKAAQLRHSAARGTRSGLDSRRARLRPISGGKSEPH
jgi:hypothetical protein